MCVFVCVCGGGGGLRRILSKRRNRSNRIMMVVMGASGNNSSLPKNLKLLNDDRQGGGECEEFFAIEEIEVVIEDIGDEIVVVCTLASSIVNIIFQKYMTKILWIIFSQVQHINQCDTDQSAAEDRFVSQ